MFGLLPGWWSFQDRDLRPSHPLLAEEGWLSLLREAGCREVVAIPGRGQTSSFGVEIQQSVIVARAPAAAEQRRSFWLVFGDDRIDRPLVSALKALGDTAIRVRPGSEFARQTDGTFLVNPAKREDFQRLVKDTLSSNPDGCAGIVYLWAMETPPADVSPFEEPWQQRICGGLLHLAGSLVEASLKRPPSLAIVTSHALAAEPGAEPVAAQQATVWGLGRALASERPELRCTLLDLDGRTVEEDVRSLLDELSLHNTPDSPEPQIAIRAGKRHAAVIERCELDAGVAPLVFSANATYMVVGGTGGLGPVVAEWMVRCGARHLEIISRRPPAREIRTRLEGGEASIHYHQADVADHDRMRELFAAIQSSGYPLKGILHVAGVLETGPVAQTDWPTFWSVLSPKVAGTSVLAGLACDLPLDFLVLFSSATTLISEPGTGAYGAANSFLDAEAQALRHQGLPAFSIGWGEWLDLGMATTVRRRREQRRSDIKIPALSTAEGLRALEMIMASGPAQCAVLPIDLGSIGRFPAVPAAVRPLLSGLRPGYETAMPSTSDLASHLLTLQAEDRERAVSQHLREVVAATLGVPQVQIRADAKITELDMDSLAVMEVLNSLKQNLGLLIYPREVFERGTLDQLASYIAAEFERARGLRPIASTPMSTTAELEDALRPAALAISQRNPTMVFVLSAPRSGSTLLRVMLAGHSGLFSPPELHLLPFSTMAERAHKLGTTYFGEGLQRALMELRGVSADVSKRSIEEMEGAEEPIQQIYEMLQKEAAPRLLVDKTPAYAGSMEVLLRAEAMFEGARYICLLRHPLAVIESFVRMRFSRLVGAGEIDPYQLAEQVWLRSYSNIRDFHRRVGPERCHMLRYEDLVQRPAEEAQRICLFLGISFEDALLHPYEGARMNDGIYPESAPLNDPNFLNHAGIEEDLAYRWKTVRLPQRLAEQTCQLASELGYELPEHAVAARPKVPAWTERTVTLQSGNHCLCCWGDAHERLVVLIHGLMEHGASWALVGSRLAEMGFRVIAPDLRGHGRSVHTPPGVLYHPLDFLGDLDELIRGDMPGSVNLVGHSMGAALAALFATARPQHVRSLVLVEPPLETMPRNGDAGELIAVQLDCLASPPRQHVFTLEEATSRLRQGFPSLSSELASALAARITESTPGGVRWRWDPRLSARAGVGLGSFGAADPLALLRSLEKLEAAVALVYGESSNLMRPQDAKLQQASLRTARQFTLPGGHNLHYDAPAALAAIIAAMVGPSPTTDARAAVLGQDCR